MRAALMVLAVLVTGCPDSDVAMPDARIPIDAPPDAPPGVICNAYGEACESDPFPSNTLCHSDKGWCINNVCRPQCSYTTQICSTLVLRFSPAGAGYCEPR